MIFKECHVVLKVSHLTPLERTRGGKMRDPGNEVGNASATEQAILPVDISMCDNPLHRQSLSDHDALGT